MSKEIEECTSALHETINSMRFNYEAWRKLTSQEARDGYLETMNRYSLAFNGMIHAFFISCIVSCYRVFEKNGSTQNLHRLRGMMEADLESRDDRIEIEEVFDRLAGSFRGVTIIRSNVFAHYSHKMASGESFEKASITPNEIVKYVTDAQAALNLLCRRLLCNYAFNLSPAGDLERMLSDLRTFRPARSKS